MSITLDSFAEGLDEKFFYSLRGAELSDPNSPIYNTSRVYFKTLDFINKQLSPEAFRARLSNFLKDPEQVQKEERQKAESEARAIVGKIEQEKTAREEKITAIEEHIKAARDLVAPAKEARGDVVKILGVSADKIKEDTTFAEIVFMSTEGSITTVVQDDVKAKGFLKAASATTALPIEIEKIHDEIAELEARVAEYSKKAEALAAAGKTHSLDSLNSQVFAMQEQIKALKKDAGELEGESSTAPTKDLVAAGLVNNAIKRGHEHKNDAFYEENSSTINDGQIAGHKLIRLYYLEEKKREPRQEEYKNLSEAQIKDILKYAADNIGVSWVDWAEGEEKGRTNLNDLCLNNYEIEQYYKDYLRDKFPKEYEKEYGEEDRKKAEAERKLEEREERIEAKKARTAPSDRATAVFNYDVETGMTTVTPETFTATTSNLPPASLRDFTAAIEEFRNLGIVAVNGGATTFTYDKAGNCIVSQLSYTSAAKTFAASGVAEAGQTPTTTADTSAKLQATGASALIETASVDTAPKSAAAPAPAAEFAR